MDYTFDETTTRRLLACQDALRELVAVKAIKDNEGKTADYERRQPLAWTAAREALGIKESATKGAGQPAAGPPLHQSGGMEAKSAPPPSKRDLEELA